MNTQVTIAAIALDPIAKKIKALNKRARRLGQPEIRIEVGESFLKEFPVCVAGQGLANSFRTITLDAHRITITGSLPEVPGGWSLKAVVSHTDQAAIETFRAADADQQVSDRVAEKTTDCDHCRKARRRSKIFYLQNEAGEVSQIGASCVKDFLPGYSTEALAFYAEAVALNQLFNGDEFETITASQIRTTIFDSVDIVGLAVRFAKEDGGYISASKSNLYGMRSTVERIAQHLLNTADHITITESERSEAQTVLDHIRAKDSEQQDQYMRNLIAVCEGSAVSRNHIGILASAVAVFTNDKRIAKRKAMEAALPEVDAYLGSVGERPTVEATLVGTTLTEGFYGTTQVCRFRATTGHALVWFNTGRRLDIEIGTTATLSATVKKHATFRGKKTTQINRVKIA